MRTIKFLVAILISIALAACGGGSGGSTTPPPPPATYSISGTVTQSVGGAAVSGATITLSGTSAATTTTAADGTYSFTGLANGSYTVTPTLAGNAFNPNSTAVTVSGANVTATNFTATAAATTYSISGTVSGAATSGVTITLSGATTGSVVTGAGGTYTFSGLVAGDYTVTPSLNGYTFAPTSIAITGLAANSTGNNFTATAIPVAHSISGNVSPTLAGVTITVTGTATATATTDASGNYTVTGLYDGSYTVTPSKTGYTFNPNSTPVTMSGANVTGTNFTGTANAAVQATVSGTVTGAWQEGVSIAMSGGATGTTTTNATGNYSFTVASGQSYTFTPTLAGYTYAPTSQTVAVAAGSSAPVTVPAMTASSVIPSYSISGTVSYAGAKTGGVRIQAYYQGCTTGCTAAAGTAIAAPGTYTIKGLPNGDYNVVAQMDAQGTGQDNANNPISPAVAVTIFNANGAANPALADPATPVAAAPTGLAVAPGSGSGLFLYTPAKNANGQEIATRYSLTWGTTAAATGSGAANFAAQGLNQTIYLLSSGLTNGTAYYFQLTACVGGTGACTGATSTAPSAVYGPVTINATTGANTVSGTVTFSGTATGPMYVAVHDNANAVYVTRIAAPTTGTSYSISGVPNGTYQVAVIIDNNNNGLIDAGDIANTSSNGGPAITVAGNITADVTLPTANATAQVGTDHWTDGAANSYSINTAVSDGVKRVVSATLFSGLNVAVPLDMEYGNCYGTLCSRTNYGATVPAVGDTYQFKVTYSDASTQIISSSVTAVLNSFASVMNVTNPTTAQPTFNWAAPTSGAPASYLYSLSVWPTAGGAWWYYPQNSNGMPSSQTSVLYNVDGTAPPMGATGTCMGFTGACNWQIQVRDANSLNTATRQQTFAH